MKRIHILTDRQLNQLIEARVEASRAQHAVDLQAEVISKQISLNSLQSQINPHFLYNALECVRGQAILCKAPVIADMVQALSSYFRYSIGTKSDIVTLKSEIQNIQNYLKIQQFRFNNRFQVRILFDENSGVMDAVIPKLTLQPILENAIQHGFERKLGPAHITIEIIETMRSINILVSDDGAGMDAATLDKLNAKIRSFDVLGESASAAHTGLAIPNIDKRLKLLFGEEYGVHVSSVEGMGTDVEIHIPYIVEEAPR